MKKLVLLMMEPYLTEGEQAKIDDEGRETKRNVLIENGVLKGYLIDEINNHKMNMKPTGSSRRESYIYAPTSIKDKHLS